jgi:MSHA biogenesis protein MshI
MKDEYTKRKLQLQYFLRQKKLLPIASGHCCMTIHPKEFSLAYMHHAIDKLVLEFYASYPYDTQADLKAQLSSIVKQYQLKKVDCSWLLAPEDYQLLQLDVLPVTANEFQAAIRWKIKDLLRFSIDDVVIDHFAVPSSKVNAKDKMMVVAAQSSYLQKISEIIKASGLNLSFIDVPELAFRNIMALSEQENQSHALVYVQNSIIQLLITYQKQLYFCRNLEFGWGGLSESTSDELTKHIAQLASEIQRSFDYYENQWRQPHPTQITFAATKLISKNTMDQLSQFLSLPVQWLHLDGKLITKQEMSFEQQGQYLPMIGELFRKEYERHATAN